MWAGLWGLRSVGHGQRALYGDERMGGFMSTASRFDRRSDPGPGPGYYEPVDPFGQVPPVDILCQGLVVACWPLCCMLRRCRLRVGHGFIGVFGLVKFFCLSNVTSWSLTPRIARPPLGEQAHAFDLQLIMLRVGRLHVLICSLCFVWCFYAQLIKRSFNITVEGSA